MEFINLKTQRERLGQRLKDRINKVIDSGNYIMGEEILELEEILSKYVGVKHCISCSNGTDALLMALMVNGVGPGDEVITTSFSFFATAEVISLLGATPVFVDINPDDYLIDVDKIASKITLKTKAIIPVSLYGLLKNVKELQKLSEQYKIPVIEDAAQSFGAQEDSTKSGSTFQMACTSFFPSKPLGCYGDGGALFTNDDTLAKKLMEIRVHGQSQRYLHTSLGINGRLDTLQAAVLIAKMEIFADEIEKRQEKAAYYQKHLSSHFKLQSIPKNCISAYAQFTLEVDNRDKAIAHLKEAGIPTSVHYPMPIHMQPFYKGAYEGLDLPHTVAAAKRVLSVPFHPYLLKEEQDRVINALLGTLK
jgi:UDP-2-acetamido-2-deoxy-ribo-hexuluronate aminotransferase